MNRLTEEEHEHELVHRIRSLDNEASAILDSIRQTSNDGEEVEDDESSDEVHDEDEMGDEILRLGDVVASIRQDLDSQSVDSMTSALSTSRMEYVPKFRYNSAALAMKASEIIHEHKLYGPGTGGEERNGTLIIATVAVWTALFAVAYHVNYGDMEKGSLKMVPDFVQKLLDQMG